MFSAVYWTQVKRLTEFTCIQCLVFNLYIDIVLITLKKSVLGCHIDGTYMGTFSYAGDITLSCPSVPGLNKIMNMCSDFATNNCTLLLQKKQTISIKYGESVIRWQCYIMAHWR